MLLEGGGIGAGDVRSPVLEAEQVAGGGAGRLGARGLAEAELGLPDRRPAGRDPGEVAHCVYRHLRIVGAGLHREVTAALAG